MTRVAASIGPRDDGRRMSLDEFDLAEGKPGNLYELGRGVVIVVEVPDPKHFAQVDNARQQFAAYRVGHPERIKRLGGGSDCKILLPELVSERHPDVAIYRDAMPDHENVWSAWIPSIVIEVVSPGSEQRDYVEKREEYLQFGVLEYWIIDLQKQQMLVLRRSGGRWKEQIVRPGEIYRTKLLPDFEFALAPVFEAARR